jgi:Holliday junction resolvase
MAHYNKGANAERELIHTLFDMGFAVLRVAGSGVSPLPSPDVVALKGGKIIAFECKAWKGEHLAIPVITFNDEVNWAKTAGAEFFIGWKVPHEGWLFVKAENFHNAGKNFMISLVEARKCNIPLQVIAGQQNQLSNNQE